MAQLNLILGTPNNEDGDFVRDAFVKTEANFTELYAKVNTSDFNNNGSDGISTFVETDELGITAFSNDYNDLNNLPIIPNAPTGLEAIDEGNGIGWRLIGRDPLNYGNIGNNAIDLSKSLFPSTTNGATGASSFALGIDVKSSGITSISMGYKLDNSSLDGVTIGINNTISGYANSVFGVGQIVAGMAATVIGQAADVASTSFLDWNAFPTKPIFVVGNGTIQNADINYTVLTRSNAFKILYNGEITAPSLTTALIDAELTGKVLITKEYADTNYSGGGVTTFAALSDVSLGTLSINNLLRWNGTEWVNSTAASLNLVDRTATNFMVSGSVLDFQIGSQLRTFSTPRFYNDIILNNTTLTVDENIANDNYVLKYDFANQSINLKPESGGGGTMATTTFTPYLTLTSTDGQAAVEELKDELDAAVIASGTDVAPMSYTTVGGETTWAIGQTIPSQHKLFINGLKVIEGVDYTISGTSITYIGTILPDEKHELYFDIAVPTTYNASEVSVDTSGFNGNLAITDNTVQKVAQKLDDLAIPTNANYVDLTTAQTITGAKTFNNGTYNTTINGVSGFGINSPVTGAGGVGFYSDITGENATGVFINLASGSTGANGVYTVVGSASNGLVSNVVSGGTGFTFVGQNNSSNTFSVNKTGDIVANSFSGAGTNLTGTATNLTVGNIQPTAISGKAANAGLTGTEELLINNAGTLEKTTTQAIADLGGGGTVDVVKNVATSTILGRVTAGSGDSEELTPTQVRTLINVEDGATADQTASEVTVDASGFNGNLAITDDTVQKVAQKLDDLVIGGGGGSSLSTMAEIATQDFKELITYNKEWLLPSYAANVYTGTNGTNTRIHNNLTLIRASNSFDYPINIVFSSGTTAGTIGSQNGQALGVFNGNSFYMKRGFYRSVVASGDRFSIGLSSAYRLGDPTNIEPDTQTNVLGIAKLSTSNNIHIIHNDASGVTTSFDLGTDYPATDTTLYYYTLEIYGVLGTSVTVKVTRITRSTGAEISTNQVITTNMPTVTISAFIWVTNNATAANSDIRDRGAIKYINTY